MPRGTVITPLTVEKVNGDPTLHLGDRVFQNLCCAFRTSSRITEAPKSEESQVLGLGGGVNLSAGRNKTQEPHSQQCLEKPHVPKC